MSIIIDKLLIVSLTVFLNDFYVFVMCSLQGCFWQQHPQLQQMSAFLLEHIQQACSLRLKDKIAAAVRELWTFVAHLNRLSRSRAYVISLLQQSREDVESILTRIRKSRDSLNDESSSESSSNPMTFESVLRDPSHSFAAKRVRYDKFDSELQLQADVIEKELVRDSRSFLADFIDTYLKHSLTELCTLSPSHPMVVDLTIYLIKQQAAAQHQSLLDFIANYGRRKLQEVCSLSCKQFAKSLRIHPDDQGDGIGDESADTGVTTLATSAEVAVEEAIVSPDSSILVDSVSASVAVSESATESPSCESVDMTTIDNLIVKVDAAMKQLSVALTKVSAVITYTSVDPPTETVLIADTWPDQWVSRVVDHKSIAFTASSKNQWSLVFGFISDVLRKSAKVLSALCRLKCVSDDEDILKNRDIIHLNTKDLLIWTLSQYNEKYLCDRPITNSSSSDYVLTTQFMTTALPICVLIDHTLHLTTNVPNITRSIDRKSITELEITSHILKYLYDSQSVPISTLVKILISTGRKSTFLYYGACFYIPEFSSDGGKTMFRAIESFLRSIYLIPTSSCDNTMKSDGKIVESGHSRDNSPWYNDEATLAAIENIFSTDLKSLLLSLNP